MLKIISRLFILYILAYKPDSSLLPSVVSSSAAGTDILLDAHFSFEKSILSLSLCFSNVPFHLLSGLSV